MQDVTRYGTAARAAQARARATSPARPAPPTISSTPGSPATSRRWSAIAWVGFDQPKTLGKNQTGGVRRAADLDRLHGARCSRTCPRAAAQRARRAWWPCRRCRIRRCRRGAGGPGVLLPRVRCRRPSVLQPPPPPVPPGAGPNRRAAEPARPASELQEHRRAACCGDQLGERGEELAAVARIAPAPCRPSGNEIRPERAATQISRAAPWRLMMIFEPSSNSISSMPPAFSSKSASGALASSAARGAERGAGQGFEFGFVHGVACGFYALPRVAPRPSRFRAGRRLRPEGAAVPARQPAARREAAPSPSPTSRCPIPGARTSATEEEVARRWPSPTATACCAPTQVAAGRHRAPLRHALLRLFARPRSRRAYRAFAARAGGPRRAGLLLGQGELEPRRARAAGAARRRLRHRLGRRAGARARRRRRPAQDACSPASARPKPRSGCALEQGIGCINLESEAELERVDAVAARARAGGRRSRSASTPTSTRRRTRTSPPACARTSSASPTPTPSALYSEAARMQSVRGRRHRLPHRLAAARTPRPSSRRPERMVALVDAPASAPASRLQHIDLGGGIGIRYQDEAPQPIAAFVARRARRARRGRTERDRRSGPLASSATPACY